MDRLSDIQRDLIVPCRNGEYEVHTLTLRVSSDVQAWTVGVVDPFPLSRLRALCIRWCAAPTGHAVDISADVWSLVRTVVEAGDTFERTPFFFTKIKIT